MTESNHPETPDSWSPAKLAAVGVYVVPQIDTKTQSVRAWICHDTRVVCSERFDTCDEAYAKATRIAKERERVKVRWVYGDTEFEMPAADKYPCIITDSRIVGETPDDELGAMRLATSAIDAYYQNDEAAQNAIHSLLVKIEREAKANAAIAAARKEGK